MEARLSRINLGFERPHIEIAHYKMLKHSARFVNPVRKKLLNKAAERLNNDGLNNCDYIVVNATNYNLFTHYLIDVGDPPDEILKYLNQSLQKTTNLINKSIKL